MTYMLDTNMIIMAMRQNKWPDVRKKVMTHLRIDACISSVVYAELVYGVEKGGRGQKARYELDQFLAGVAILPFDAVAAAESGKVYAELDKKRMRIGDRDAMIAAHARSLGYTVVTDNIREFSRVEGLSCENWK